MGAIRRCASCGAENPPDFDPAESDAAVLKRGAAFKLARLIAGVGDTYPRYTSPSGIPAETWAHWMILARRALGEE